MRIVRLGSVARSEVLVPLALVALVACTGGSADEDVDSDGDGLTDAEEAELGSDPENPDSDDDMLEDAAEVEHGSDPLNPDSDGDSYLDGWEVTENKDPNDEESRIYKGYWPYNPAKADIEDPGPTEALANDEFIYNHVGRDQFGQKVELYDFLGQGKDVIIDASAQWCQPCQITALWLSSHGEVDYFGYEGSFGDLRQAVDDGDVLWVTVLVENNYGNPTNGNSVMQWDEAYPHEKIPVIADEEWEMLEAVIYATGFYPSGVLLNENGKVIDIGGMDQIIKKAQSRL